MQAIVNEFASEYNLSQRETEVLAAICTGMKNTAIAQKLGISPTTVRLHITSIHRKLGTFSKVDMVLKIWRWWMRRHGW